jgi:hypothetical protein
MRRGLKIVSYYVVGNEPLVMEFSIDRSNIFDMQLLKFVWFVAKSVVFDTKEPLDDANPFILNDAVVIKQRIKPSPPIVLEQQVPDSTTKKKQAELLKWIA